MMYALLIIWGVGITGTGIFIYFKIRKPIPVTDESYIPHDAQDDDYIKVSITIHRVKVENDLIRCAKMIGGFDKKYGQYKTGADDLLTLWAQFKTKEEEIMNKPSRLMKAV